MQVQTGKMSFINLSSEAGIRQPTETYRGKYLMRKYLIFYRTDLTLMKYSLHDM